jgi:hypothetical protein
LWLADPDRRNTISASRRLEGLVRERVGPEYRFDPVERRVLGATLLAGERARAVADEVGISLRAAKRIREHALLVGRRVWHSPHRLSCEERERIMVGIAAAESDAHTARVLGRARSTVGREIAPSCRRRSDHRASRAEQRADGRARRPKERKLERSSRLSEAVAAGTPGSCCWRGSNENTNRLLRQ